MLPYLTDGVAICSLTHNSKSRTLRLKKDFVYFNPGKHDKSFKIKAWDLKKISKPKLI